MQWTWRRSTGKWKSWSYWTILTLSSFTRYCIIINVRIVCIYNTFVIIHQLPMQAIWFVTCIGIYPMRLLLNPGVSSGCFIGLVLLCYVRFLGHSGPGCWKYQQLPVLLHNTNTASAAVRLWLLPEAVLLLWSVCLVLDIIHRAFKKLLTVPLASQLGDFFFI